MTIAELHNVVDMANAEKKAERDLPATKGIVAIVLASQLTVMAWHVSYWF
jgi:hypothetical protein